MTTPAFTAPDSDEPDDAPSPIAAAIASQCPRNPWCVRGKGHKGFCGKRPAGEGRAPRERKPAGERKPRAASSTTARRAPAKNRSGMRPLLGLAWSALGQALEAYGPDPQGPPVGRIIQFQAPYASGVLDKALHEHVPAYRALDKATGGILDELGPIILPPILVAIMASSEGAQAGLMPVLASQIEVLAAAIAAERKLVRDSMTAAAGADEETQRMTAEFLSMIFAPRPEPADMGGWPDDAPAPTYT